MRYQEVSEQTNFPMNETGVSRDQALHYTNVVCHKIQMLKRGVEEISQKAYTSLAPLTLSEILVRILSRFYDELKSDAQKLGYPPEDALRKAQTINYVVVAIIPELIEAIESANIEEPIVSIIEAYQQIANHVRYGTQTIIYPRWEYNASSHEVMDSLKTMTREMAPEVNKAIFSGAPSFFPFIIYPKAEEKIVLRQAVIAHELGHFIDRALGLSDFILDQRLIKHSDYEKLQSTIQEFPVKDRGRLSDQANDAMGILVKNWTEEAIADFLAICILGPAYLFAFDEISFIPKELIKETLPRSHPPESLRRLFMSRLVQEWYLDVVSSSPEYYNLPVFGKQAFTTVSHWVKTIISSEQSFSRISKYPDLPPVLVRDIYSILHNTVVNAVAYLQAEKLAQIRGFSWFCNAQDVLDALRLQELLQHGLTPTELYVSPQRDPSFAAVMNSGWFFLLHNEQSNYSYFQESGKYIDQELVWNNYISLQNLIAKAVESLLFKREFNRRNRTGNFYG